MNGDTQFTRTKHLNDLYFLKCAISTHNFLKSEWIHGEKNYTPEKFHLSQRLWFVTINGNILSFLYLKSNVGIRPPTSAHKYMQIC